MLKATARELLKQLEAFEKEFERKLTFMVKEFAYYAGEVAVKFTPLGQLPQEFYDYRNTIYSGFPTSPGMAKGSWDVKVVNISSGIAANSGTYYGVGESHSLASIDASMDMNYKLGKSFYVYNKAPYMTRNNGLLANAVDPSGNRVLKPTVDEISKILSTDLIELYNRG
jgi:hypothetical protein